LASRFWWPDIQMDPKAWIPTKWSTVPDADLPWYYNDQEKSGIISNQWYRDLGQCAYLSTRHELIYATKSSHKSIGFLLSETFRKWRHMSVPMYGWTPCLSWRERCMRWADQETHKSDTIFQFLVDRVDYEKGFYNNGNVVWFIKSF